MIIKKCNGLRGFLFPVCVSVWVSCVSGANAWQQEYIAIDTKSNTSERYTWDSDHQPRYEDILAERMKSSETPGGLALNQGLAPPDSSRGMSVGWNYLLADGMTSGPVASLRSDYSAPATKSVGETGYVNTLGWRMDYQSLWGVHPWAQVSYNQSLASDAWSPTTRAREGGWSDVTLGADMPLGSHVAAWATLSQADNVPSGENTLYLMGVSANF